MPELKTPIAVAVTVLARAPEPGRVKSRLAASVGVHEACALHEAMALDVLETLACWASARQLSGVGRASPCVLSLTGDARAAGELAERAGTAWRTEEQPPGDLGERIVAAVDRRLAEGFDAALVVGTDAPLLSDDLLDGAVAALAEVEVSLAAARDGGFVLLGARHLPLAALRGVAWGGPEVLRATLGGLRREGVSSRVTGEGDDVDDAAGLERLAVALADRPGAAPRTRQWLREQQRA